MPPEDPTDGQRPPSRAEPQAVDVLTITEVSRLLRIGRNSAYDAARRGELPVVRIGRRLLVPRVALERLLAGHRPDDDGHHRPDEHRSRRGDVRPGATGDPMIRKP